MASSVQISLRIGESGSRLVLPAKTSRRSVNCTVRASNQESDGNVSDRRLALASILGAGILAVGAGNADAKTKAPERDYYQELLENTKNKPSTSDLLKKYQQLNEEPKKGGNGKGGAKKPSASKPSAAKKPTPSAAGPKRATTAAASASSVAFNPVEVGLGLAAVAGAVLLGRKPAKKESAAKAAVPAKKGTVVRPAPTPVKKSVTVVKGGTVVRPVAPPSRPGTVKKAGTSWNYISFIILEVCNC